MSRRRRTGLAGNTAILTVGTVVQTVIALVTVPLYLTELGEERFGVFVVAGLVITYFGLLDRGLATAVQDGLARLGEEPRERTTIVSTAVLLNVLVGLVAALGVLVVGEIVFAKVIEIPEYLRTESVEALPELAASVPLVMVSSIFSGSLIAQGRIATVSAIDTFRIVALQLIPLGLVYWQSPDLRWLALGVLVALALSMVAYATACFALVLRPIFWTAPSRAIALRLFHYGKWVTATSVLTPILDYSDRIVIGAVRGASAVTAYSIPYNLTARLTIIPFNVVRIAFPQFSAAGPEDSRAMARRAFNAVAAVTAPLAVCGAILAGPFFDWWLGARIAEQSAPIAAVLFAGFWVNGLGYVPYVLLQAQGRPDLPARYHTFELVPFLVVLGLGVYLGGAMGAAIAWSFRALTDALLLLVASSIGWRSRALVATSAVVLVGAVSGAVFAFETTALLAVGVPLVLLSLVCGWGLAPEEVREWFRGVRRPRRMHASTEGDAT